MLLIVRNRTKRRFSFGFRVFVTVLVLALTVSHLYSMYNGKNIIKEGWLRDDRPSGNPLRVENTKQTVKKGSSNVLDQFVVKLKDFYQKDQ